MQQNVLSGPRIGLFTICLLLIVTGAKTTHVTCGSVLKLLNADYRIRLHSHDVKYGTGSGQQSVTGTEIQEDANSHWYIWLIKEKGLCERGWVTDFIWSMSNRVSIVSMCKNLLIFAICCISREPIKCGDTIRLEHLTTKKNLHSHFFQSPLSGKQEISCYGEDGEGALFAFTCILFIHFLTISYYYAAGVGDTGDFWKVECSTDVWLRDNSVKLRHKDTDAYLAVSGRTFGRPINGQMEVIGTTDAYHATEWKAVEGLYVHARDAADSKPVHSEL